MAGGVAFRDAVAYHMDKVAAALGPLRTDSLRAVVARARSATDEVFGHIGRACRMPRSIWSGQ